MEVLLNLVWMLLALPAWWLWRRRAHHPEAGPWQCLLALACLLVLLFPVISASDDLSAVRAEMEENGASRTASVKALEDGKAGATNYAAQAALPAAGQRFCLARLGWFGQQVSSADCESAPRIPRSGRAPPQVPA